MPRKEIRAVRSTGGRIRITTARIPHTRDGRALDGRPPAVRRASDPPSFLEVRDSSADVADPTPSLEDLIDAYQREGRPDFRRLRSLYEHEQGQIRDSYFAKHVQAGAVIVKPNWAALRWSQRRKIHVRYDGLAAAHVQPAFEAAIWRARALERQSGLILSGRSRKVLIEMLYTILVYLLGVLDATSQNPDDRYGRESRRTRVAAALACAETELKRLEEFARDAARRESLRSYLLGLPLGVVAGCVMVLGVDAWSPQVLGAPSEMVSVSFACGAAGAIVSVMTRITRGQSLVVDVEQGRILTVVAGGFRPLIGAVFGVALYVFVSGGIVPLEVPTPESKETLFFAALAFLAGFSERWAQDTIVKSAPITSRSRANDEPTPADVRREERPGAEG